MAQDMIKGGHIVAESTNILSTNFGGGHIYSIVINEPLDNGMIVARDTYSSDEYEDEVWKMKKYAAGDEPLLLLNPPVVPFTALKTYADEDRFYNDPKDGAVRAYTLHVGDRISLSEAAFDKAPEEKQYVTFNADSKIYEVGDSVDNTQFCAQVLKKIVRSNLVMYKLQVMHL